MTQQKSDLLKETMSKAYLHQKWVETYIADSKEIYDLAFNEIKKTIWRSTEDVILDAGCGNGVNTIRLVERGFDVVSTDFSDEALKLCKLNILENKCEDKVTIKKEDLLDLQFANESFDSVLCWGVLMHIFEIEKAINELCRVIKSGGFLVICEVSQNAIESLLGRIIKKIIPNNDIEKVKTKFGIDYWSETQAGRILVRKSNISSLIKVLDSNGFKLIQHIPGQFTQLYTRVNNSFIKKMFLKFNLYWFKYLKSPGASREQIMIFKNLK